MHGHAHASRGDLNELCKHLISYNVIDNVEREFILNCVLCAYRQSSIVNKSASLTCAHAPPFIHACIFRRHTGIVGTYATTNDNLLCAYILYTKQIDIENLTKHQACTNARMHEHKIAIVLRRCVRL